MKKLPKIIRKHILVKELANDLQYFKSLQSEWQAFFMLIIIENFSNENGFPDDLVN